eukprot:919333_1
MSMVINRLGDLQQGFENGVQMMCDTLKEGFEVFGRKYRDESRCRSRSLSDSGTPPKRNKSRKRRSKSCTGQNTTPSIPSRQWPVRLLAEHAYKVSKGQREQSTAYYKMCAARSGGINKYYKSVLVCLVFKRIKISLDAYQMETQLGALCDANGLPLTVLSQTGAKNAGYGSTAGWSMNALMAKALLSDALMSHLVANET